MSIEHIQLLRGTSENLALVNPVLLAGEMALETDTGKFKFGDGTTEWNGLSYSGGDGGTTSQATDTDSVLNYHNAGTHNALYRGKDLGDRFTDAQSAAIQAGTFEGIYVGDSWAFNNVPYTYLDENDKEKEDTYSGTIRVGGLDEYLNTGYAPLLEHHAVVLPDAIMFSAPMNDTDTTQDGYGDSKMRRVYLRRAEAIFKACFGEYHVLKHYVSLVSNITNGVPPAFIMDGCVAELMDERMVYGSCIFDSEQLSFGDFLPPRDSAFCKQLNLFRHRPDLISNRQEYWLRNAVSSDCFARVNSNGYCSYDGASSLNGGVRPFALIA